MKVIKSSELLPPVTMMREEDSEVLHLVEEGSDKALCGYPVDSLEDVRERRSLGKFETVEPEKLVESDRWEKND